MTRYYPHVAVFVRGLHAHPTWRLVAYNSLKSPLPLSLVVAMSGISSLKQYLQAEKASRGEQQKDVPDSDFLLSVGGQELKATNAKQADWKQLLSKAPEFTGNLTDQFKAFKEWLEKDWHSLPPLTQP